MGMKIPADPTNQPITSRKGSDVAETRGDTGKARKPGGDTKTPKDMVSISALASILSSSVEGQALDKPFNEQLVNKLRAEIKSGNYKVEPEVLALKFFRFEAKF